MFYDWVGLGTGGVLALIGLIALTVVAAVLAARRRGQPTTRRSSPAAVAAAVGLPSPVVAGLAIGFSRGGRRVPTRQAMVSASVGVVGLVAVAVFGASLDRTLEQPHRYGWEWDASVAADGHDEPTELDRRGVTDAAVVSYQISARLDGVPIPGMSIDPVRGRIDPVLVRGEAPVGEQEVLVGERTLDDLDLDIGDHAELRGPDGERDVRIVGTSAFIAPDDPLPLARGVLIHPTVLTDLGLDEGDGYRQLAVEVDGDARRTFADLTDGDEVIYPHAPVEVSRLDDVRSFPSVLAGFLAVLAALGVGQLAFVMTRRRRRDLGTLRALGFTRRQVRRAVFAQSGVVVAAGLIIGVPSASSWAVSRGRCSRRRSGSPSTPRCPPVSSPSSSRWSPSPRSWPRHLARWPALGSGSPSPCGWNDLAGSPRWRGWSRAGRRRRRPRAGTSG